MEQDLQISKKVTNLGFTFECKLFDKNERTTAQFPIEAELVNDNFLNVEQSKWVYPLNIFAFLLIKNIIPIMIISSVGTNKRSLIVSVSKAK